MVYNNVLLTVKQSADIPEVGRLLRELQGRSRTEPGCERFEVYQSQDEPRLFMLIERWTSAQALAAHREAPAFLEILRPKVMPLVDRAPHLCELLG